MTSVVELLKLPSTSNAFSALPSTVEPGRGASLAGHTPRDVSGSPPRKAARLHDGPDSASRARKATAASGPKKVRIELNERKFKSPETVGHTALNHVSQAVRVLLNRGETHWPWTYEHIYDLCRSIVCYQGHGEGLHSNMRLALEQCVSVIARSLEADRESTSLGWLVKFNEACDWFEKRVALLQSLLSYLDRVYLLEGGRFPNIHDTAYTLLVDRVLDYNPIASRVREGVVDWVTSERETDVVEERRAVVKELVRHLHNFNRYTSIFESAYIEATQSFYQREAKHDVETHRDNAINYLRHVKVRIAQEIERGNEMGTRDSVVQDVREAFLGPDQVAWISTEAMKTYMPAHANIELVELYDLLAKVNGLEVLCAAFKQYTLDSVKAIVTDTARDEDMIDRLVELKSFTDQLVSTAFAARPATFGSTDTPATANFSYALRDAFHLGFRARRVKPAEMIAKHLDRALKRGQRSSSDAEFGAGLDEALGLYRFTEDKDVFRAYYHRLLSKRLLLGRSASDDFEKAVLKRLKEEYDPDFNMGDHMFNDLAISRELMAEYYDRRDAPDNQRLSVMVLQRSFWPFSARKTADITLPPQLAEELRSYDAFYSKVKHKNRKLDFDHALGTATMHARFKAGAKDLSVSLYQAVVLLLFNGRTEVPFGDIKAATGMDDAELRRTLQSLACGKKKVLRKVPPGRDVEDEDVFVFNDAFTDPRTRVQINSIQSTETPEEAKKTETVIASERSYTLDAAIVRVMKAKRRLTYEALKAATIDAVKSHFVPDIALIKKRIGSLVESDYLTRDEEDMNVYVYVT